MRYLFVIIFLTFLWSFGYSQNKELISKTSLDQIVLTQIDSSNTSFNWSVQNDSIIYSALILNDSLLSIGFKPADSDISRNELHTHSLTRNEWQTARAKIIDLISNYYLEEYPSEYIFPFGVDTNRPYINARIFDIKLLKLIRQLEEVRYTDPMTYEIGPANQKSSSGCSPVNQAINASDTVGVNPDATLSWHNSFNNIQAAWNISNKGEHINLAIIDTGLSPTQSKLNSDFTEGESSNRTVVKKGFYAPSPGGPYDGWQDQCGHGTSMSGIATAPKGYDHTPCGIAYKANLISYRATEDVVINTASEKDGVSASLYHAADTTVHIISMSIGDLFFNGQVADAIAYAEGKGKLIFAAAGTSSYITNGYGVIFPADMNETIAVTGVKEGNTPFTRCDVCHDGPETDFVVKMERTSDNSRHAVTLGEPDLDITYVGGSSCATSSLAGQAALIWSSDTSWNKSQVLDRMIRSSNYFPNRNEDHGWGIIDLEEAVDNYNFMSCDDSLSYTVSLEITDITFPPVNDGLFNNTAEWVLEIGGTSFFFEVDTDGDSGNPVEFLNNGVCGYFPMIIDIGSNSCGINFLDILVESHEDDGGASDCSYSSFFDGDFSSTSETIYFVNNSFTHSGSSGTFSFSYQLHCTPVNIPSIELSGDDMLCVNGSPGILDISVTGGNAPYTLDYTINNGTIQNIYSDNSGNASLIIPVGSPGTYSYMFNKVVDNDNCIQLLSDSSLIVVSPPDYSSGSYGPLSGIITGIYDYETDGILDSEQIIESGSQIDYDSGSEINLLPGFEIKSGVTFYAFIDGCNNGDGGLNIKNDDSSGN